MRYLLHELRVVPPFVWVLALVFALGLSDLPFSLNTHRSTLSRAEITFDLWDALSLFSFVVFIG